LTVTEPLPAGGYGKADWVDYTSYWREGDAEWLMERSVLRFASKEDRATQYSNPKFGQVTYNESSLGVGLDRAEMYSKQHNAWVPLLMLANITSTQDDSTGVALSHKLAGGKGVILGPGSPAGTGLVAFSAPIDVLNGVLTVKSDGMTLKVGSKSVKLTTDATSLVSDSPVSATGLTLSGMLNGIGANFSGTVTVSNISMSGTLSGNGVLNGASGTIGGVALGTSAVGGVDIVNAASGYQSQNGMFYGDGSNAYVRQRVANKGALGTAHLKVNATDVYLEGQNTFVNNQLQIRSQRSIQYFNAANNLGPWSGGPVIWGADPGVANVPDGTIWVS
jgi:hypothetical protein